MLHVVWIKRKAGRFYEEYKICDHNRGVRVCNIGRLLPVSYTHLDVYKRQAKYINPEKDINSAEDAVAGAKDIIAEAVSDEADYRTRIRDLTMKKGHVTSTAKDPEAESVYEMY